MFCVHTYGYIIGGFEANGGISISIPKNYKNENAKTALTVSGSGSQGKSVISWFKKIKLGFNVNASLSYTFVSTTLDLKSIIKQKKSITKKVSGKKVKIKYYNSKQVTVNLGGKLSFRISKNLKFSNFKKL